MPSFKVRSPPPPPPPPPRRPVSSDVDSNLYPSKDSTNMAEKVCLPMARGWSTVSSATDNTAVEVSFVEDAPDANVDVNMTTFTSSDESDDDSNVSATKTSKEDKSHHNNNSRRCFWIIAMFIALTALAVAISLGVQVLQSKRTKMQEAPAPASKKKRRLFQLDLDTGRFVSENVGRSGAFQGGPDQITRLIGKDQEMILYFTEDGGTNHPGVHGRDADGNLFMILESQDYGYAPDGSGEEDESTGLAFSPDHMHMYVCYQKNGVVFDITRRDGKTFGGRSIDVKYHKLVE